MPSRNIDTIGREMTVAARLPWSLSTSASSACRSRSDDSIACACSTTISRGRDVRSPIRSRSKLYAARRARPPRSNCSTSRASAGSAIPCRRQSKTSYRSTPRICATCSAVKKFAYPSNGFLLVVVGDHGRLDDYGSGKGRLAVGGWGCLRGVLPREIPISSAELSCDGQLRGSSVGSGHDLGGCFTFIGHPFQLALPLAPPTTRGGSSGAVVLLLAGVDASEHALAFGPLGLALLGVLHPLLALLPGQLAVPRRVGVRAELPPGAVAVERGATEAASTAPGHPG